MINIEIKKYLDFSGKISEYKVDSNQIIGDFILKLQEENIINDYTAMSNIETKQFIGYDFLLNKKFNQYPELNKDIQLSLFGSLNHSTANKKIVYPLVYYKNSLQWPPGNNWKDGDSINLGQFLIWNGWGSGPITVPQFEDNHYQNLIVLKYVDSSNKEIKKVINKYAYYKAIEQNNKDPLTNKQIDNNCIICIKASISYKQLTNRPLLEIPINFVT